MPSRLYTLSAPLEPQTSIPLKSARLQRTSRPPDLHITTPTSRLPELHTSNLHVATPISSLGTSYLHTSPSLLLQRGQDLQACTPAARSRAPAIHTSSSTSLHLQRAFRVIPPRRYIYSAFLSPMPLSLHVAAPASRVQSSRSPSVYTSTSTRPQRAYSIPDLHTSTPTRQQRVSRGPELDASAATCGASRGRVVQRSSTPCL